MTDTYPEELREMFLRDAQDARSAGQRRIEACFKALAASVKDLLPELLAAAFEVFDNTAVEHNEISQDVVIDSSLTESIRRGQWFPASATEYLQRFVAFSSGTQPFRYDDEA
jgi:hypothetical protein